MNPPELQAVYDAVEALKENPDVPRAVKSELENMQWFEGYAMASKVTDDSMWTHTPHGIVAADWNDIHERDTVTGHWTEIPYGQTMKLLGDMLESCGVVIEWSDCVSTCGDCGKCIQTEPDSYPWEPEFTVTDGDILCHKCYQPKELRIRKCLEENESLCCDNETDRRTLTEALVKALEGWEEP